MLVEEIKYAQLRASEGEPVDVVEEKEEEDEDEDEDEKEDEEEEETNDWES